MSSVHMVYPAPFVMIRGLIDEMGRTDEAPPLPRALLDSSSSSSHVKDDAGGEQRLALLAAWRY